MSSFCIGSVLLVVLVFFSSEICESQGCLTKKKPSTTTPSSTPWLAPSPTPTMRTPEYEGEIIVHKTCSFICGLNDQWYPARYDGLQLVNDYSRCWQKGSIVPSHCAVISYHGTIMNAYCFPCCERYWTNHCNITCNIPPGTHISDGTGSELSIEEGCDPFDETATLKIPTPNLPTPNLPTPNLPTVP